MKNRLLLIFSVLCTLMANAQEQTGIVKTIGRPGLPGQPLEDVLVRAHGNSNTSKSDHEGFFSLVLANYKPGQAYSISRVTKMGYRLADDELIGRQYPYSAEIPLEISMISNEDYYRNKMEIEERIRARIETEYEDKLNSLRKQLDDKTISDQLHMRKLAELNDYYDKSSNLIDKLADRYARIDYDRLDSIDMRINVLIEQGMLDEAEKLILSKGTKKALEELKQNNIVLSKTLEEGRLAEAKMVQDYATELYLQFDIASMRFDNVAAAGFLKERMELDTTNVMWKIEYAAFVRDYLGQYDEAMTLYVKLLETTTDPRSLAEIYGCLGNVYQMKGQYDSALSSYRMSMEIRECDSLTSSLASSYLNMGSVYLNLNKYDEADSYLQKAEELFKEGEDTLGLAGVYNKQAVKYSDKGEYDKAEELLMKSLDMRLKLLGENNLRIANEYINCALLMTDLARFGEAADYVDKAIAIRYKILGENHPDIADAYQVFASIKMAIGDFDSALEYYENSLDIFIRFYGDIHPEIASIYNNLAHYHITVTNDFHKAKEYYTKALDIHRLLYGEIHSATATGLNNLASAYNDLAEYETSLELYEQALMIWTEIYGETHINVGDVYNNLATVYYKLGKYNQAEIYQRKALDIYLNVYGEMHSVVALAYENLGSISMELNRDQDAFDNFDKASSIYKTIYGEIHISTANVYDKIGQIYYKYKMYDNAEAFLSEAMNIRTTCLGDDNVAVASSYNNLGLLYLDKGEYATAEEMFHEALEITKIKYGAEHPKNATLLGSISTSYRNQKLYDKALEYLLKALQLLESAYSEDHPLVLMYRYGLGDLYYTMGRFEDALPLLNWFYYNGLDANGLTDVYSKKAFRQLHLIYNSIMGDAEYKGGYEAAMRKLNENTIVYAEVAEGYQAAQMGYSGKYAVVAHDEWNLDDNEKCFLAFQSSISSRQKKTYVFYRDGDFIPISFEGGLGVWLAPTWVTLEEKSELIKSYKKWYKKNRRNLK